MSDATGDCVERTDEHCLCWVKGEPCCRCGDDTDGTGYCEGITDHPAASVQGRSLP